MAANAEELFVATEEGVSCCQVDQLHGTSPSEGPRPLHHTVVPSPWQSIAFPWAVQIAKIAAGERHRQAMYIA